MESQATGMMMLDASKRSLYKDLEDNILVNLAKAGGSVVMLRDNKVSGAIGAFSLLRVPCGGENL